MSNSLPSIPSVRTSETSSGDYDSVIINIGLESTGSSISKKMMIAAGCVLGFSAAAYLGKDLILNYFLPPEIPMPMATTITPSIPASPLPEPASLESMVGSVLAFLGLSGLSIYQFNSQPKAVVSKSIFSKPRQIRQTREENNTGLTKSVADNQGKNPSIVRARLPYVSSSFKPWKNLGVEIGGGIILNPRPGQFTSSVSSTGSLEFDEDVKDDSFSVVKYFLRERLPISREADEVGSISDLLSTDSTDASKDDASQRGHKGRLSSNHIATSTQERPSSMCQEGVTYAEALKRNLSPQIEENATSPSPNAHNQADAQTDYSNAYRDDSYSYEEFYNSYYGLGDRGYFSDSDMAYLGEQSYPQNSRDQEHFSDSEL